MLLFFSRLTTVKPFMSLPPVMRAIAAQAVVLAVLVLLRAVFPLQMPIPLWVSLQAAGAAALGRRWGLGKYWMLFQTLLPIAIALQAGFTVPLWLYPTILVLLFLIYGGGVLTRVPLYLSRQSAWKAVAELIPENKELLFVDLGAGLGGPLAYIAKHRPRAILVGVEASPLVWLIGYLRTARFKPRCHFRLGSIWKTDLRNADYVFAFLSPAPMSELWAKARREMKPGSAFISHSFEVPGQTPKSTIPLPGKKDAALLVYSVS